MGRGRIRRGYSLEVIFEEDSDFCSHLDSLDSVAIRFGVKETDDTISVDSLVEEYRIRFQGTADKEHVFRSLDGIWDVREMMDTCFVEWDEFSDSGSIGKMAPGGSSKCEFDPNKAPQLEGNAEIASSSSSTGSVCTVNGRSNSSPKIIPTRVTNKKALHNELELKFKADLNNSRFTCDDKSLAESSPIISTNGLSELGTTDVKKVRALFETSSSRKSSVGEDSNSSTTSSSGGSSSQRIYSKNPASPTNSNSNTSIVGGVHKKLKQLVNNNNNGHHQTVGKVLRSAYSQFNLSTSGGGGGGRGVDFAELLVNDRVVIEDSPDLFQTLRRSRRKENGHRDSGFSTLRRSRSMGTGLAAIEASLSPCDKLNGLKNSKNNILAEEMPAPDTVKNVRTVFEQILKSRNSNDTTTNQTNATSANNSGSCSFNIVNVTKKSLSSVKSNPSSKIYRSESLRDGLRDDIPSSSSLLACRRFGKPILMNESGAPVVVRGASMSPLPGEATPKKCGAWRHAAVERQHSEPIKFSPKVNCPFRPRGDLEYEQVHPTLAEESLSLLSSLNDTDDDPPKFVSPEILQRIRSCGSTTTYFGGQVIAQSGRNRRQIPVSRRHTLMDFKEFNPADGDFFSNSFGSNSSRTTPTATHHQGQISSSSGSPSSRYELNEEYFTPPPIPTPVHQDLCLNGFITIENDEVQVYVPRPKLLPRRVSPELEDVFNLGTNAIDTTPRIISVLPKSPSGSPVSSIIEGNGRGTPEGCEGQDGKCVWSNEIFVGDEDKFMAQQQLDRNNNNVDVNKGILGHRISSAATVDDSEGAWF
ncbi:uncharacterized protein LOC110851839 isoform X3 [Folsomia candida]|uniref:uncharacterized protein LOC110851839 isoform X3 n=1 Tax=Folsomia candida TaxID=158441 RepID=UPI000B8F6250|nr:uncharacterized protein LOC110851839 isoform X3 [Folsomia candida]